MVHGYTFYGENISNIAFVELYDFYLRHLKNGCRQYKSHNISITTLRRAVMLMALDKLVDSDIQQCTGDLQ